jgi:hypothetical protein
MIPTSSGGSVEGGDGIGTASAAGRPVEVSMRMRVVLAVALPTVLAGCLDVAADSAFRPDGSALVTAEIGISSQLLAALTSQGKPGLSDPLADCEKERPVGTLPAGVRSIKGKRGQRGEMATCTYVIDVADPVAASVAQRRAPADRAPALRWLDQSELKIERLREGVYRLTGRFTPIDNPLVRPGQPGEEIATGAMLLAMAANRYVTLSVSAARIENATGEVQADGRKVVWKLPLLALVKSVPGTPSEIKADIVYAEGWTTKVKRWLGME